MKYQKRLPQIDEENLKSLILKISSNKETTSEEVAKLIMKTGKSLTKSIILALYLNLKESGWVLSDETEKIFLQRIKTKNVRTISGVTPVTVMTKPYPCPGDCIFCPNDIKMPKSYLSSEPGAQRAASNNFDPYLQTYNRLVAFKNNGHSTNKIELIILGGTWSVYPLNYQIWFVKRCFDALNDFRSDSYKFINVEESKKAEDIHIIPGVGEKYNSIIGKRNLKQTKDEEAGWQDLSSNQKQNELAEARCVGLVIETRPDQINASHVLHLRRLGVTKVQLGVQSLNNSVLIKNKRKHTLLHIKEAFKILRLGGFKIQIHWMLNLYGVKHNQEVSNFAKLFSSPFYKPDELKIYPCSLIKNTELYDYYKKGKWKPYTTSQLTNLIFNCMVLVPRYCRVNRVIRDISSGDIVTGNKKSNIRQLVDERLKKENKFLSEIRSREIKNDEVNINDFKLKTTLYATKVSRECFLEYVNECDKVAGFLRLSLPNQSNQIIQELVGCAIIREIHVYGLPENFGALGMGKTQHLGLGKKLIEHAQKIADTKGYKKLAVISSVGTKEYYRKNGFIDGIYYQYKII